MCVLILLLLGSHVVFAAFVSLYVGAKNFKIANPKLVLVDRNRYCGEP